MIIMLGVSILTQLKTLFEIESLLLDEIYCINYFIFIKKNKYFILVHIYNYNINIIIYIKLKMPKSNEEVVKTLDEVKTRTKQSGN